MIDSFWTLICITKLKPVMSIDIRTEIIINRLREDVAAYAMDCSNDSIWINGITSSQLVTDPPLRKGSLVERVAMLMGRRIEYNAEVVGHVPGRLLDMRTNSPFSMVISFEFEDVDGGTLASVRIKSEDERLSKLAGSLLSKTIRAAAEEDLRKLKKLMEESGE